MTLKSRDSLFFHHALRTGKNGMPFIMLKFRTMKKEAASSDSKVFDKTGGLARKFYVNDPRLGKLGRLARRFHLDELPQIIDVFSGKMLPVGVRPLLIEDYKKLPTDVKKMYDEMGPGLAHILYAVEPFPPASEEQIFNEIKKFYKMWKKNKWKTYWTYAKKILINRLTGKSWTQ